MKKLIFVLIITIPFLGFGQCVKGDCKNGVGTYLWADGTISNGTWKEAQLNGIVQEIGYNKEGKLVGSFDGEMKMGVISGWGTETLYDKNGSLLGTYVGEWKNDDYNGWGVWIWSDGTIEKGTWKDGQLIKE